MKRVGIFADITNLYYTVRKNYDGERIDYKYLLDFIRDFGEIKHAIAYGAQTGSEASTFISVLKSIGWTPKYKKIKIMKTIDGKTIKKGDWDVGITVDMIKLVDRLDMIVLCSSDIDFTDAVKYLVEDKMIDVVVIGCRISRELKSVCTRWIEIPESLLEDLEDLPEKPPEKGS